MFKKLILALVVIAWTSISYGQVSAWNDPNIFIPASTVPHQGLHHTNYMIYKGKWVVGKTIPDYSPEAIAASKNTPAVSPAGFWPSQIHTAYNIPNNKGSNAIAITIAFDNPGALTDFQTFSAQFGLPTETSTDPTASTNKHFQVVYANGTKPSADAGWSGESSLDIEWSHAMAPNAKIYLVESQDNGSSLYDAVTVAHGLPGVKEVNMSWAGGESSGELSQDSVFQNSGCVYFGSAGDSGGVQVYPSESPYVISVGGTHLVLDTNNNIVSQTAWSESGGGPSSFEPRPSYQNVISSIVGAVRGDPDISAVADPATGVAVYSSFGFGGWGVVGGTSVSSPLCAGIANARGQFSTDTTAEHTRLYSTYANTVNWKKLYFDVLSGTAGGFTAAIGWDFITGVGVPINPYPVQTDLIYQPVNPVVIDGTEVNSNPYNLVSQIDLPYGQTAAVRTDFVLDKPLASYTALTIAATMTSPLRATSQLFIYNPASSKYEVLASVPGTGVAATTTKDVFSLLNTYSFSSGGQTIMRFAYRGVVPARASFGPFSFKIGTVTLSAAQ